MWSLYGMTCGRYIKRRNNQENAYFFYFLSLKGSNSHVKYDFLTPGGANYLHTKYQFPLIKAVLIYDPPLFILVQLYYLKPPYHKFFLHI